MFEQSEQESESSSCALTNYWAFLCVCFGAVFRMSGRLCVRALYWQTGRLQGGRPTIGTRLNDWKKPAIMFRYKVLHWPKLLERCKSVDCCAWRQPNSSSDQNLGCVLINTEAAQLHTYKLNKITIANKNFSVVSPHHLSSARWSTHWHWEPAQFSSLRWTLENHLTTERGVTKDNLGMGSNLTHHSF